MKKILTLVACLSLIASLAVGGSIAYLTATDTKTNTFTLGNVNIAIDENEFQDTSIMPGIAVDKKVQINNTGDNDAWVWMSIKVAPEALKNAVTLTFTNEEAWDSTTANGVHLYKNKVTAKNNTGIYLQSVALADNIDIAGDKLVKWENGTSTEIGNLEDLKKITVTVKAYAIQAEGFSDVIKAYNGYQGQTGGTQVEDPNPGSGNEGFAGGEGTAEAPYLINEAAQLMNISKYSDDFTYFKVADGVKTLDMTDVGQIVLNGSFDGNGVTMNNLTTSLFKQVGKTGEAKEITISNLTANVHTTDGGALVKNIYNSGNTTFKNVTLHGYIEGQYNMGSFYNYGTANASDFEGADYTVTFINTTSDATLVNTTGNAIGGMLGHGYEGENYKLSINMDEDSGYSGTMYTTGTATCYEVMAMCSHSTYNLNGKEVSRYENTYPSTKLTVVTPELKSDGYYVTPVENVDHYVVRLNSQLTAYDTDGNKIANKAGMTWSLGSKIITDSFDGKIFDTITSAEIINGTGHELGYALNDGKLTIYSGRSDNYASGWVTLYINQYDADNKLLATGKIRVYEFAEP